MRLWRKNYISAATEKISTTQNRKHKLSFGLCKEHPEWIYRVSRDCLLLNLEWIDVILSSKANTFECSTIYTFSTRSCRYIKSFHNYLEKKRMKSKNKYNCMEKILSWEISWKYTIMGDLIMFVFQSFVLPPI